MVMLFYRSIMIKNTRNKKGVKASLANPQASLVILSIMGSNGLTR